MPLVSLQVPLPNHRRSLQGLRGGVHPLPNLVVGILVVLLDHLIAPDGAVDRAVLHERFSLDLTADAEDAAIVRVATFVDNLRRRCAARNLRRSLGHLRTIAITDRTSNRLALALVLDSVLDHHFRLGQTLLGRKTGDDLLGRTGLEGLVLPLQPGDLGVLRRELVLQLLDTHRVEEEEEHEHEKEEEQADQDLQEVAMLGCRSAHARCEIRIAFTLAGNRIHDDDCHGFLLCWRVLKEDNCRVGYLLLPRSYIRVYTILVKCQYLPFVH